MRIEAAKWLHDAWSASAEIVDLVVYESFATYRSSRVLQLAIEHLLAIMGGAWHGPDDQTLQGNSPETLSSLARGIAWCIDTMRSGPTSYGA
jgi:hypothetical protein